MANNATPTAEQIDAMSEEERVAFAATRKNRRANDKFLFDEIGLEDWCNLCWVRRGVLSRMFIDDGYPVAEMECAKCHYSYNFNVCDL